MTNAHPKKVSDHISELRNRIFICLIFFLLFSSISYVFHNQLLSFLLLPINAPIYFTSPTGGFALTINVSLLFGLLCSLPVILFQVFSFVAPAFSSSSKKLLVISTIASTLLMLIGVLFAYFVCLPAAFTFLGGFEGEQIKPLIGSTEYFSFVSRYVLGFGLIFQLPLILIVLNKLHPLPIRKLIKITPYVVLGSFIISAILTPTPDPINQSIMAIPIIILYVFSVLGIKLINN